MTFLRNCSSAPVCAESATICKHRGRRAVRFGSRHPCSGLFWYCFPIDSGRRGHCSLCVAQNRESLGQIVSFHAFPAQRRRSAPLYFHCCLQWSLPFCCIAKLTTTPSSLANDRQISFAQYYQSCFSLRFGRRIYRNLQA